MSAPRKGSVVVLVGTRKGAFIFTSDARRKSWSLDGPHFLGLNVHHFILDPRDQQTLYAATYVDWWGSDIQRSKNWGRAWLRTKGGVRYAQDSNLSVKCAWHIRPGRASEPGVVYAGVDPAGLFRSEDGGYTWKEVTGINRHPTRAKWQPGAGGMTLHSIVLDPENPKRMFVGISAAGVFRTEDDGATWTPQNKGTRADFQPDKFPEVGQCVHKLLAAPPSAALGTSGTSLVLYQQNHCGVYRSDDAGNSWKDLCKGLPSRFGFPIGVHPRDPKTIWVVPLISDNYRSTAGGCLAVYRSTNCGRTWQKQAKGLPARNAHLTILREAMSTDSCDPAGVYFGTETGQLFCSRNEGREWKLLADFLPPIYSVEAAVL
ncbi:MAG: exo-alpha-sialidase [Acidobacteria bacterium]|nr:exo-alpha-sialidase [Acidobacteriota bacterium]MBI3663300.1 exo-alpha-sialidase [Acidobacteriota bacterium]